MKFTFWTGLVLGLCVLAADAHAAAGHVIFVDGDAYLERAAKQIQLVKGVDLQAGDLLVTGLKGRVQLAMQDGDRIALHPNTHFRVDEFKPPRSEQSPETGRSFYSLLRGGFRALTRSMGKRDESSYRVKTPVATIGIRGTHYSLQLCAGHCQLARAGDKSDKITTTETEYAYDRAGRQAPKTETIEQDSSEPGLTKIEKTEIEHNDVEYNDLGQITPEDPTQFTRVDHETGRQEKDNPDLGSPNVDNPDLGNPDIGNPDLGSDGLYVDVFDGIVNVHNDKGSLDLHKGERGYVRDGQTAPVKLKKPPPPPDAGNPRSDDNHSPRQSVHGTDPFGKSVDLTPGQAPESPPPPPPPPTDVPR